MITKNYTHLFVVLLCSLLCFSACSRKITENGKASYYADKFEGRKTASGETYHQGGLTAAHRTLPFGTKVKVLNISNGKSVTVRINDRGPFSQGRVIDLSKKAAKRIGMLTTGVAVVEIKYKKKKK
ncbi:septal ring lytic transglycosylase RlpA family protein [Chitinophaga ginsengisoli]|uniref:Probable endolytic peptidoglycan transglycosylase RlpA n=1 Tax=Chitinophaga ginsengisoli TaxID=363837 RepID=A0A2P8GNH5_9BACT|nr:septal ring lytic transglycosylase RlpA family protein [Chitinophaga ginsengisoli]PSL35521.1 rare lipoprotein A [Chitinophaga ginsengisoli]